MLTSYGEIDARRCTDSRTVNLWWCAKNIFGYKTFIYRYNMYRLEIHAEEPKVSTILPPMQVQNEVPATHLAFLLLYLLCHGCLLFAKSRSSGSQMVTDPSITFFSAQAASDFLQ